MRFRKPVGVCDTVTVTVTAKEKRPDKHIIIFDYRCVNQSGEEVTMMNVATRFARMSSDAQICAPLLWASVRRTALHRDPRSP